MKNKIPEPEVKVEDWPQVRVRPTNYARLEKLRLREHRTMTSMVDVLLDKVLDKLFTEEK